MVSISTNLKRKKHGKIKIQAFSVDCYINGF
jgi:hypothetical protein